jgi:predicted nucleic acid-binding protein
MTRFFDSNILLYFIGADGWKKDKAEKLLETGGTISVQVLNEFINAAKKKTKLSLPEILEALAELTEDLTVIPLTVAIQKRAVEITSATNVHIYDANIIAAAELSGCDVLYTEDLSHGQKIGRVSIVNPFV